MENQDKTETRLDVIDKDMHSLQKEVLGVKYLINSHGDILKDIKEVLIKQQETIDKVSDFKIDINNMRKDFETVNKDLSEFKVIFKERKDITDHNNEDFKSFMSRFKGGITVAAISVTIIQGFSFWFLDKTYSKIIETEKQSQVNLLKIKELEMKLEVSK